MPQVDGPIGIGRPVVQHVTWRILAAGSNLFVNLFLLPDGEPLRLCLGQIRLHREVGIGKVQGCLKIARHCFSSQKCTNSYCIVATSKGTRVLFQLRRLKSETLAYLWGKKGV